MSEDFYEVLGVDRDADEDEINRAYRRMAAKYHPDVSDEPDAEERFKRIQKAKTVLTDEEKRAAYDRLGHEQFTRAEKHGGYQDGASRTGDPFAGGDPFGSVEDIFEQFFGGGSRRRRRGRNGPSQGRDLRTNLTIDLEEAYRGATKQLTFTRPQTCPDCSGEGHPPGASPRRCPECNGHGQVTRIQRSAFGRVQQTQTCRRCEGRGELIDQSCRSCGGDGVVRGESTLSVEIPKGIRDGQTLRMEGEGAPGERGGSPGDLLIDVSIAKHPDFERDGDDLHTQHPISFPQAVFGDTVEVPTLGDPVELRIPPGTQSGEVFSLSGHGMPRLRRRGAGDLEVHVQVVTPQRLSQEERQALEAFAEAGGEEIEFDQSLFDRIRNSL